MPTRNLNNGNFNSSSSPTEVGEIVRNYLTSNGYKVEKVTFDVGQVSSGHPMQEETTSKFTGATAEITVILKNLK